MNTCRFTAAVVVAVVLTALPGSAFAAKCLFISSYHQGYAWSDGVEHGVRSVLDGNCDFKQFDMDTKRHKSEQAKQQKADEAKALIESWRPDVVITADDNAAKYLIQPFFQDAPLPFVFCGVNWTAKEYGFPYSNVTGMVEVAPIRPLLEQAIAVTGPAKRALYLGADTLTESKNLKRFQTVADQLGIHLDSSLSANSEQWLASYRQAQGYDFIILGSNSGINDWDDENIQRQVLSSSQRFSVTNHGWMMPYAMFGLTKVPQEQGEWAATTALEILRGTQPSDIPIIANRKWDLWINEPVLQAAAVKIPKKLRRKAKRI